MLFNAIKARAVACAQFRHLGFVPRPNGNGITIAPHRSLVRMAA